MAEKYTRLFLNKDELYTETSPVIISAHALLKDNVTGEMVAQLKFQSISDKIIKAVKVNFKTYDTAHRELDSDVEYEYLDLTIRRSSEFGAQTPIVFENTSVRYFDVTVTEVVFEDSTVWTCPENAQWESLAESQDIFDRFIEKPYLVEKYRIFHNCKDLEYYPARDRDLWVCGCGEINHANEESCYSCGNKLTDLENIDFNALEQVKVEFNLDYAKEKTPFEKAKSFMGKGGLAVAVGALALFFLFFLISALIPSAEEKRAELIEANFIGKTFESVETEESSDLYKTVTTTTIEFESETAANLNILLESYKREKKYYYYWSSSSYYTNWEQWLDDVETNGVYDWHVTVYENGLVTVTVDNTTFSVTVDKNDMPQDLYDTDWGCLYLVE